MNMESLTQKKPSSWLIFLLAASCGLIVANLYYAQPLVGPIGAATGISSGASGLIVTMTQLGYAAGLLFLVPLSDLLENRRLVVSILIAAMAGLLAAAVAKNSMIYFAAAVLIGLGSTAAQILVPFAAHIAPPDERGSFVGKVMSGLLLGIMLARPVASIITDLWNWQAIFFLSAGLMAALIILLRFKLPKRVPTQNGSYGGIIKSMLTLIKTTSVLRRRSLYHAALFGSFSLFWTVVPLWLSDHFHMTQREIALFGLVGVSGAIAAPVAGRLADRGWTAKLTGAAFLLAVFSFAITHAFSSEKTISLALFCSAAILLDMAVSGNLILSQQVIFGLGDEIRGRVNGVFMAVFFAGGAVGSAIGGWAYAYGAWNTASLIGAAFPVLAFLYYLTENLVKRNQN
jgi:predicted MFS family arabinose efflux permease